MGLFGLSPEEFDAAMGVARPMVDWVWGVPAAELAAEIMAVFGPEGPGRDGKTVGRQELAGWLFRGHTPPALNTLEAASFRYRIAEQVHVAIMEAMQLLEHAELVCVAWWGETSPNAEWRATRFGLVAFTDGKDAVRQRIKDRTGQ